MGRVEATRTDEQGSLVPLREEVSDGLPQGPDPRHGNEGLRDAVDEDRHDRAPGDVAQKDLQRLNGPVVELHPPGDRRVKAGVGDVLREVLGDRTRDVQRARLRAVVADRERVEADTERRHDVVEETVVVIRREDYDQFRVVVGNEGPGLGECTLQGLFDIGWRLVEP